MRKIILFVVAFLVSMATCSQTSGKKASSNTNVPFEVKRSTFFADGSLDEYTTSEWNSSYTFVSNEVRRSASGAMLEQVEFAYDEDKDWITSKITRDMEDRLKNRVVYQYYPQGFLWREILVDNKGKVVSTYEYTYDTDGNKRSRSIQNRAGNKLAETTYTYDASSKMAKSETKDFANNAISSTKYSYNDQGNILKEEVTNGEGKITSITNYSWQDNQEVENEMTAPDGKVLLRISSEYGTNGELVKKTIDNLQGESKQFLRYEYVFRNRR